MYSSDHPLIVSVKDFKANENIEFTDYDTVLEMYLRIAEEKVSNQLLKRSIQKELMLEDDEWYISIPQSVRGAIIVLTRFMFYNDGKISQDIVRITKNILSSGQQFSFGE